MTRILITASLALALAGTSVMAAPCKDPKTGRFIKCPPPAAKQVCKDAKDKFAKCGAPGVKPVAK